MNLLYIWSDAPSEFNSSYYRALQPSKALAAAGYSSSTIYLTNWLTSNPESVKVTEAADLIVFQRNVFGASVGELLYWLGRGKKIAIDLDDAYHFMTEATGSRTVRLWQDGIYEEKEGKQYKFPVTPMETLNWGVQYAGIVTTPSKLIASDWGLQARSYVIPNYIDTSLYIQHPVYHEPGVVYVGWFGSDSHMISWRESGVKQALIQICKEYPKVKILLGGESKILTVAKGFSESRRVVLPYVSNALISKHISRFDIGLVPVAGDYDRRRSYLKSLEYTAMGVPWIGSNYEPCQELKEAGVLVDNTVESWYMALKDMIDHLPDYRARAARFIELGRSYGIHCNTDSLWGKFEAILNEAN
jgi:glycosyltransferase involved in cell wall biosynthesis